VWLGVEVGLGVVGVICDHRNCKSSSESEMGRGRMYAFCLLPRFKYFLFVTGCIQTRGCFAPAMGFWEVLRRAIKERGAVDGYLLVVVLS
jgi:hypothetical protein